MAGPAAVRRRRGRSSLVRSRIKTSRTPRRRNRPPSRPERRRRRCPGASAGWTTTGPRTPGEAPPARPGPGDRGGQAPPLRPEGPAASSAFVPPSPFAPASPFAPSPAFASRHSFGPVAVPEESRALASAPLGAPVAPAAPPLRRARRAFPRVAGIGRRGRRPACAQVPRRPASAGVDSPGVGSPGAGGTGVGGTGFGGTGFGGTGRRGRGRQVAKIGVPAAVIVTVGAGALMMLTGRANDMLAERASSGALSAGQPSASAVPVRRRQAAGLTPGRYPGEPRRGRRRRALVRGRHHHGRRLRGRAPGRLAARHRRHLVPGVGRRPRRPDRAPHLGLRGPVGLDRRRVGERERDGRAGGVLVAGRRDVDAAARPHEPRRKRRAVPRRRGWPRRVPGRRQGRRRQPGPRRPVVVRRPEELDERDQRRRGLVRHRRGRRGQRLRRGGLGEQLPHDLDLAGRPGAGPPTTSPSRPGRRTAALSSVAVEPGRPLRGGGLRHRRRRRPSHRGDLRRRRRARDPGRPQRPAGPGARLPRSRPRATASPPSASRARPARRRPVEWTSAGRRHLVRRHPGHRGGQPARSPP